MYVPLVVTCVMFSCLPLLLENKGIEILNLNDNSLGSEGLLTIAAVLKTDNKTLREISLKSNEIGNHGAASLVCRDAGDHGQNT